MHVLGDSQVIINWELGRAHVKSLELNHWLEDTRRLMEDFIRLYFHHIYLELNVEEDTLSKLVLGKMDGNLRFSIFFAGVCIRTDELSLFIWFLFPSLFC